MSSYKKAINFDLYTKKLKKYYPTSDYHNAYRDIEKFLKNNGFEHRQWSGYVSQKPLTNYKVNMIVEKMREIYPWLNHCVRKFDVTNVGKCYDLSYLFTREKYTLSKSSIKPKQINNSQRCSIDDVINNAKKSTKSLNNSVKMNENSKDNKRMGRE